jgi:hypothetical protein
MIAILTDPEIGGTFLTWSIYYLSGRTSYFSVRHNKAVEVCDNPLTGKNAHKFLPNQPCSYDEFANIFQKTLEHNEHLYMHQLRHGTEYAVAEVCKNAEKIIILSLRPEHVLYRCGYTPRANVMPGWNSEKNLSDPDSIYEDFTEYFFKESKRLWAQEGLNNVWDKREFIALNFDPFKHSSILDYINTTTTYYQIDALDAWVNLDQHIDKLFSYLDIPVDQKRFEKWISVYGIWKNNHTKRLNFVNNFELIIDNIINDIHMDLETFDLDLSQESAIQHVLIYKHNLNLKTWQLTKFPNNTQELHKLLEPNIHAV